MNQFKLAAPVEYLTDSTEQARLTPLDRARKSSLSNGVDDVKIYNYALTATQVKNLYNEGSAVRFGPSTGSP